MITEQQYKDACNVVKEYQKQILGMVSLEDKKQNRLLIDCNVSMRLINSLKHNIRMGHLRLPVDNINEVTLKHLSKYKAISYKKLRLFGTKSYHELLELFEESGLVNDYETTIK